MTGFNFLYSAALCYGPLALIILGFVAFAAMTDANARRTYLRRLDMRPEADRRPSYTPAGRVAHDTDVATPSGARVTRVATAAPPAMTRTVAPAVAVAPAPAAPAPAIGPDNLARIEGIGPKINSVLQAAGIQTFAELAARAPAEIRSILDDAGITQLADPTTWPAQAALAARGDWAALTVMQDNLKAGRAD